MITDEERERERALFESERRAAPELFERPPMIDDGPFLKWIGIEGLGTNQPIGYLRLMPQDFIVEEIAADGNLIAIDTGPLFAGNDSGGATHYAELVKIGISTLEAKAQIASALGIDERHVGFAGIKDRLAITSQRISVRNIADTGCLGEITAENFFLKNIRRGKGVIANGDLEGNRFVITLRSPEPIAAAQADVIRRELDSIKHNGFWNFFSFQRFGTPRLISHWLGLLLVKGEYAEMVKTFLTYTAARELPYFQRIRNEIAERWGDWVGVQKRIDPFPYHFSLERTLADHLATHPGDFIGALRTIPDQVRLWFYAYDCFLFNRKLSELIRAGAAPPLLPLITSFNPKDWEQYRAFLDADGVRLPSRSYRDFPFVRVESRTWPTLQRAEIHGTALQTQTAVFAFSLPKGSYATTLLANFFTLASGLPLLPGIPIEHIDARALIGLGTIAPVLERFRTVLERREQDIAGGSPE